jgi:hypothetical protein
MQGIRATTCRVFNPQHASERKQQIQLLQQIAKAWAKEIITSNKATRISGTWSKKEANDDELLINPDRHVVAIGLSL